MVFHFIFIATAEIDINSFVLLFDAEFKDDPSAYPVREGQSWNLNQSFWHKIHVLNQDTHDFPQSDFAPHKL